MIIFLVNFFSRNILSIYAIQRQIAQLQDAGFACYYLRETVGQVNSVNRVEADVLNKLKTKKEGDVFEIYQKGQLMSRKIFYIAKATSENASSQLFSLYVKPAQKPRIELVRGIDQMEVLYGVACATTPDICDYLTAQSIRDWRLVRSLQINLHFKEKKFSDWRIYATLNKKQK